MGNCIASWARTQAAANNSPGLLQRHRLTLSLKQRTEIKLSESRIGLPRVKTVLRKDFADLLNVIVLGRTDLSLTAAQITDYYSLRFQIEFNFRDAKQYGGLEDFMNVSPTAVTNAANLAFLMVNLSAVLLTTYRQQQPDFSVFDLEMHFRTRRYLREVIKSLPDPPDPNFIFRLEQCLSGVRRHSALR
jgi:hypothetical protein